MLTSSELIEKVIALCEEFPDNVNPFESGGCQYQHIDGRQCIMGYLLTKSLGLEYSSSWEGSYVPGLANWHEDIAAAMDQDAALTAEAIQMYADGSLCGDGALCVDSARPRRWGEVAEWLRDRT